MLAKVTKTRLPDLYQASEGGNRAFIAAVAKNLTLPSPSPLQGTLPLNPLSKDIVIIHILEIVVNLAHQLTSRHRFPTHRRFAKPAEGALHNPIRSRKTY